MKTIMVVDDESDILEQVKACLEEDDFHVVTVDNSRTALEMLEDSNENQFGLLLIDTALPGSKKTALFSMKPASKIQTDVSNEENFLQKPFTKDQLLAFVKRQI